jgi:hypothetical protein
MLYCALQRRGRNDCGEASAVAFVSGFKTAKVKSNKSGYNSDRNNVPFSERPQCAHFFIGK